MSWNIFLSLNIFITIVFTTLIVLNRRKFFSFYIHFITWLYIVMFAGVFITFLLDSFYDYFNSFGVINLIFPFLNELRVNTAGFFHNELLEIFSFFWFVGVYYFLILKDMFCDVTIEFKLLSFFLMFILLIGSLIQINIFNPYIGIIVGLLFALMSQPKSESNSNSSCIKYFD